MIQKALMQLCRVSSQLNALLAHTLIAICQPIGNQMIPKGMWYSIISFSINISLSSICHRFLYTQFLAIDGNFKLCLKEHGITDPELAPGWAYFVEEGHFQNFIKDYVDQPEVCLYFIPGHWY